MGYLVFVMQTYVFITHLSTLATKYLQMCSCTYTFASRNKSKRFLPNFIVIALVVKSQSKNDHGNIRYPTVCGTKVPLHTSNT